MMPTICRKCFAVMTSVMVFSAVSLLCSCMETLDLEPRETSDLSVRQLIHRQNKATDPKRKWRRAGSYEMRLRVTIDGKSSRDYYGQEIKYQAPKRFRLVMTKNNAVDKILIYNEGRAWSVTPKMKHIKELFPKDLEYRLFLNTVRMGTPSLDYTDIFRRITVDMFTEKEKRYYRMICYSEETAIQPYIFYFDGISFLQVKLETAQVIDDIGTAIPYTSYVEDYVTVDDIKLPSRTVVKVGDMTQTSELEKIVINPTFPESDFLPPRPFTHEGASEGDDLKYRPIARMIRKKQQEKEEEKKQIKIPEIKPEPKKESSAKTKNGKQEKEKSEAVKKAESKWYDFFGVL